MPTKLIQKSEKEIWFPLDETPPPFQHENWMFIGLKIIEQENGNKKAKCIVKLYEQAKSLSKEKVKELRSFLDEVLVEMEDQT